MATRASAIVALLVMLAARPGAGCQRATPIPAPDDLIRRAEVIVLATAVRERTPTPLSMRSRVEFHAGAILKGRVSINLLPIPGSLVPADDFNDSPAPYTFVRPTGRRGSCFADTFKEGGQFLLMLRPTREIRADPDPFEPELTPYWEALAPTDEQVTGPRDPWVRYVREVLTRSK